MRWFVLFLFGMITVTYGAQIQNRYDKEYQINAEFSNVYQSLNNVPNQIQTATATVQSQQFNLVVTTPALNDLLDRQIVIFSSGAVKIMFRESQEIYAVNASCVTVIR